MKPDTGPATREEIENKAATDVAEAAAAGRMDEGAATASPEALQRRHTDFEKALLTSLLQVGFTEVKYEVAIDFGPAGRFVPDALATAFDTTFLVEAKLALSPRSARSGIEQLERLVHLYDAAYPSDQITGLLVFAGTSPEELRYVFGQVPPTKISVIAFDPDSGQFDFPYENPFWWRREGQAD